jgi:hypothetical protein
MKTFLLVTLVLVLSFCGCDKETELNTTSSNSFTVMPYPLKAGNVWHYRGKTEYYNFRQLVFGYTFRETVYVRSTKVEIIGECVLRDSVHAWRFRSTSDIYGTVYVGDEYYVLKSDTLFLYAYNMRSTSMMPKISLPYSFILGDRSFPFPLDFANLENKLPIKIQANSDTIVYFDNPHKSLVFPLKTGSEWSYLDDNNFRIHKKVIDLIFQNNPTGYFQAFKIQWLRDFNGDHIWDSSFVQYDYISLQGLVQREYFSKDMKITSAEYPEGFGLIDMKSEDVLTSYIIH